jgi:hypothetical protein
VTTCLDCDGNILVSTVGRLQEREGRGEREEREDVETKTFLELENMVQKEEEESHGEVEEKIVEEVDCEHADDKEVEPDDDLDENEEVWVADGEVRRERLVLPGSRESIALYQVNVLYCTWQRKALHQVLWNPKNTNSFSQNRTFYSIFSKV